MPKIIEIVTVVCECFMGYAVKYNNITSTTSQE